MKDLSRRCLQRESEGSIPVHGFHIACAVQKCSHIFLKLFNRASLITKAFGDAAVGRRTRGTLLESLLENKDLRNGLSDGPRPCRFARAAPLKDTRISYSSAALYYNNACPLSTAEARDKSLLRSATRERSLRPPGSLDDRRSSGGGGGAVLVQGAPVSRPERRAGAGFAGTAHTARAAEKGMPAKGIHFSSGCNRGVVLGATARAFLRSLRWPRRTLHRLFRTSCKEEGRFLPLSRLQAFLSAIKAAYLLRCANRRSCKSQGQRRRIMRARIHVTPLRAATVTVFFFFLAYGHKDIIRVAKVIDDISK